MTFSLSVSSGSTPDYNLSATGDTGLDHGQVFIGPPNLLPSPSNPVMNLAQATPGAGPLSPTVVTFAAVENGTGQSSAANVTVSVTPPFGVNASPSRTTFATSNESIYGAVYDPFRKLIFAAAQNINSVLAFSSTDGHLVASIPVPLPYSVDETPDGSSLFVGTFSSFLYRIDPGSMQIVQRYEGPPPLPIAGILLPTTVTTLSNGKLLALVSQEDAFNNHIMLFDPLADAWTDLDPVVPFVDDYSLRRSYDHSTVVIVTGGGGVIAYDANSNTFSQPLPTQSGSPQGLAISPDGSQIVIYAQHNVLYYDGNLKLQTQFTEDGGVASMAFSRNGQSIYVAGGNGSSILSVRNASDYTLKGNIANLGETLGLTPTIFDSDETGMVFEGDFQGGLGLGFVDSTVPGIVSVPIPDFNGNSTMIPETGLLNAPGATTVNGGGFVAGAQVFFGPAPASAQARPGTNISVQSQNVIQVTPPAGATFGPVNVTVVQPSGNISVDPQAYSYGPQVGFVFPNAGPATGGAPSSLTGFGLASPNGPTLIKVGGNAATNTTTPDPRGFLFGPSNMGTFNILTPSGSPGVADVTVTLPEGNAIVKNGYQYLAEAKVFAVNGALGQIVYDRPRQRLYVSNFSNDRIEVFSLQTEAFGTPISVGKMPLGLALTPDGSKLAVANSGDGTVSIIDPSNFTVIATVPALTAVELNPTGCGAVIQGVAAVIPHRMILTFSCPAELDGGGARILNLDNESFDCTGVPTCNTVTGELNPPVGFPFIVSTTDGTKAAVGDGGFGAGVGLYDLNANTFISSGSLASAALMAINDDGNLLADSFGLINSRLENLGAPSDYSFLNAASKSFVNVANSKLHPSGSLYYVPQSNGVDIFDVNHERLILRISSVEAMPSTFDGLAIDETGAKMFLISKSGITIEQLSQVPLSVGSVTPSSGPASGGTLVTIRGSGFVNGATVTFGTTSVSATFVDASTLQVTAPTLPVGPVRISITNPDGRSYQLDVAYQAQ
jgi:YVTN family beta-propeller protein